MEPGAARSTEENAARDVSSVLEEKIRGEKRIRAVGEELFKQ